MGFDIDSLEILNPKLKPIKKGFQSNSALFSYYAGFSENFTVNLLDQLTCKNKQSTIFDPWNGSGTTTFSAYKLGQNAIGNDLNPVMLIIAKARLINVLDLSSLEAICYTIFHNSSRDKNHFPYENDPLNTWFSDKSCILLRKIENSINKNFICFKSYSSLTENNSLNKLSTIGAFVYVVLFKTIKTLLKAFIPSNPTWVKKPKKDEDKLEVSYIDIKNTFFSILDDTVKSHVFNDSLNTNASINLHLNNSTSLSQTNQSVDIILTSPPYCTRIDYAIATSIELATIRVADIRSLRENLIGTSTVKKEIMAPNPLWGKTCNTFLKNVQEHTSIASSTYYYKNHLQYFDDIYKSIEQISRILKLNGLFISVVQNSFYKEINNDLAKTLSEMSQNCGLNLIREDHFQAKINMSSINSKSNRYISKKQISESVLIFKNIGNIQ